MDIKLNDEQFAQVIGKQILESIGTEARDKLVTDAIVALNKVPSRSYGVQDPSPLQQAFNTAVHHAVHALVRELVEESPVRDRIREAAEQYITIFPEEWQDERLQTEILAAIVRFARDNARTD